MNEKLLFDLLSTHSIPYKLFRHNPVFTAKDELILIDSDSTSIPGSHSKNLFLKDKKNNTFFLVSVVDEKRVDLKTLSDVLGASRFSFGSPEELLQFLKLQPGSVTPFGLMFDEHKKISFVLDQDFLTTNFVNFHPLRNDMTLGLEPKDFLLCMKVMGHEPQIIQVPV